jgi:hypothetical protein
VQAANWELHRRDQMMCPRLSPASRFRAGGAICLFLMWCVGPYGHQALAQTPGTEEQLSGDANGWRRSFEMNRGVSRADLVARRVRAQRTAIRKVPIRESPAATCACTPSSR